MKDDGNQKLTEQLFCDGSQAQPYDPDEVTGICNRCLQGTYAHWPLYDRFDRMRNRYGR